MTTRRPRARLLLLVACLETVAGCATVREIAGDVSNATKSVKYKLAGVDPAQRGNLERGLVQLKAGEHTVALRSLRRALWDVERIEQRSLRLEELAETYRALADVYSNLRKTEWANEHRALAAALGEDARPEGRANPPERSLTKAKAAYHAAKFRKAVGALREGLVDLERVAPTSARLGALKETRCYLVLAHFALDQEERAREEIRRLAALDGSVGFCQEQAPPAVQALIRDVQASEPPGAKQGIR